MKWLRDLTGRFPERPYYDTEELDELSEGVIVNFLQEKYGSVSFPVSTEDLTILIESETSDLDQYADLTPEGDDVEGVTFFFSDRKPIVKIAEELAATDYREHRLRTTLTHELAHVRLHGGLWQFDQLRLLPLEDETPGPRCKRGGILRATQSDWMEWQAGYVSGALLMPVTSLKELVHARFTEWGVFGDADTSSAEGASLIRQTAERFDVSQDAARVRLAQLGFLIGGRQGSRLALE